ncbi:hypothetical protein [Variovorax sp. OV329]|uniref:hypothetical protein n=1 Tax=Variovorax sp. OV329 TaxID=1882825 RepID=UPI0011132F59|nr:hypothetical protein [Variovorax sp. OV329]
MSLGIYLTIALAIAASIPVIEMIANWCSRRFRPTPSWSRSAAPERLHMDQKERSQVKERVRTGGEPSWTKLDLSSMPRETQAQMTELAIGFDGRQYTYCSYRYDRLSDAINYVQLMRSRGAPGEHC